MNRQAKTRRQLVSALLAAPDKATAIRLARSARKLVDDETARLILERFNRLVKGGRSPVSAAGGPAQAAAAVASVNRSPVCRAVAHRTAGVLAHLEARPSIARRRLDRAAELFEAEGARIEAGDVHRLLVDVRMLLGDDAGARRSARRAKACYAKGGGADSRRSGSLAMNVGNLHHRRDELRQALAAYSRARRHFERAGERRLAATVDYNRANILTTLDRTDQARELYTRARDVFMAEKVPALVAHADSALAAVDLLEGRLDTCIARLDDVKKRQEKIQDQEGVAHADLDQAEALLRLNRSDEAAQAARRAEKFFKSAGHTAEAATCAGLLAGAALQQGRPERASRLFQRGRELERRRRNPVGAAMLEIGWAQAEIRAGRPERAFEVAARSTRVSRRHGLRSREARGLAVGAEAALRAGRPRVARNLGERALRLARGRRDLRVQLAALAALARIESHCGRPDVAYRRLLSAERCVERLRRGINTEESRLAFAADKSEVYEALIMNRLERGDPQSVRQALTFAERGKARALAEQLSEGQVELLGVGSAEARRLLDRLRRVERELALAESRLEVPESKPGLRGATRSRLVTLTEARMKTLRRLSRTDPERAALAGAAPRDPWDGVQALGPDEIVLEYVEAGGQFHLFLIERDGVTAYPRIAPVAEVRDLADLLRFQLGKGVLGDDHAERFSGFIAAALRGYLEGLHDLLLGPVSDRLDGRQVRIVPHGVLHGLPFHAMERGGTALIDRSVVSYAPSLTVIGLLSRPRKKGASPPLVLGVPDRSAPLIDAEVQMIRRHLRRTRVFRGSAATSRAVRLSENRPPLLHVACHGFYAEHSPLTGALRLGDAWLSLPEIYTLRGTAELVVLSGCETGRGTVYSGDEWSGLVRGFLQAGARSVVASLWEVHDRSAVTLMDDFYGGLAGGMTVAEALALAQRKARRANPLPLRWAPFMVIGDPGLRIALRKVA